MVCANINLMEDLLTRAVDDIIVRAELEKELKGKKKLRLKFGVDPSSSDLHLGHAVALRKLRAFQDLGHTVILLIGDMTARIGDPSGKNKTRPVLTEKVISANAQTYLDQAGKILDIGKAEIRRNSEWLDKWSFGDLLGIAGQFTVAQLIEREDFRARLKAGNELGLHELLYPVMQAYDSVILEADVEFGGTDQRFNLLAGRDLQKKLNQRSQQILMTKLLVGLDGQQKMSKSLGNYVGLTDAPADMFGKIMSLPDELIAPYYELCTDVPLAQIKELVKTLGAGANPRDAKASLAREIVALYHGTAKAEAAEAAFNQQFRDRGVPETVPTVQLQSKPVQMTQLLVEVGLAKSKSEARRLIEQKGVRFNDDLQTEDSDIHPKDGDLIKVGRRYIRLKIK